MDYTLKQGDFVVAINGIYKGKLGTFVSWYPAVIDEKEISNLHRCIVNYQENGGNTQYSAEEPPDNIMKIEVPHKIIANRVEQPLSDRITLEFLEKYVSENALKEMCDNIYRELLTKRIDEAINNSGRYFTKSYFEKVLSAIAEVYVAKFQDQYDEKLMKRFEEIINTPPSGTWEYDDFFRSAKEYLEKFTEGYIKDHPDEIKDLVWGRVQESANAISQYGVESAIKNAIDIDGTLKRLIQESTKHE